MQDATGETVVYVPGNHLWRCRFNTFFVSCGRGRTPNPMPSDVHRTQLNYTLHDIIYARCNRWNCGLYARKSPLMCCRFEHFLGGGPPPPKRPTQRCELYTIMLCSIWLTQDATGETVAYVPRNCLYGVVGFNFVLGDDTQTLHPAMRYLDACSHSSSNCMPSPSHT